MVEVMFAGKTIKETSSAPSCLSVQTNEKIVGRSGNIVTSAKIFRRPNKDTGNYYDKIY